jgi:L-xylulose reductase
MFNVSQSVSRKMIAEKRAGSIVNVSSQASMKAIEKHAMYASSKAAMDMMTKVMALELGPHKIRVNAVNPTVVLTELGRAFWGKPEMGGPMLEKIPLRRFAGK